MADKIEMYFPSHYIYEWKWADEDVFRTAQEGVSDADAEAVKQDIVDPIAASEAIAHLLDSCRVIAAKHIGITLAEDAARDACSRNIRWREARALPVALPEEFNNKRYRDVAEYWMRRAFNRLMIDWEHHNCDPRRSWRERF